MAKMPNKEDLYARDRAYKAYEYLQEMLIEDYGLTLEEIQQIAKTSTRRLQMKKYLESEK